MMIDRARLAGQRRKKQNLDIQCHNLFVNNAVISAFKLWRSFIPQILLMIKH